MAFNSQATVPSPPATRTLHGLSPSKRHHSSAATGSRSERSTTWAGLIRRRNIDRIAAPSLLPDFLFAATRNERVSISLNYEKGALLFISRKSSEEPVSPTTISGFQSGQTGGTIERSRNLRLILLRLFTTSKLLGGMIISLNSPKSHSCGKPKIKYCSASLLSYFLTLISSPIQWEAFIYR